MQIGRQCRLAVCQLLNEEIKFFETKSEGAVMIYEIQESIGSMNQYADITPSLSMDAVSGLDTELHKLKSKLDYMNKLQKKTKLDISWKNFSKEIIVLTYQIYILAKY